MVPALREDFRLLLPIAVGSGQPVTKRTKKHADRTAW
jgi:hypothetical protein